MVYRKYLILIMMITINLVNNFDFSNAHNFIELTTLATLSYRTDGKVNHFNKLFSFLLKSIFLIDFK